MECNFDDADPNTNPLIDGPAARRADIEQARRDGDLTSVHVNDLIPRDVDPGPEPFDVPSGQYSDATANGAIALLERGTDLPRELVEPLKRLAGLDGSSFEAASEKA